MEQVNQFIPKDKKGKKFVLLANYGELNINGLENRTENGIDGIRVAFHKKDLNDAIKLCESIKEKGYEVFVQAMVSLSYSDAEFLDLIHKANSLSPYAFYIVDSFGVMKQNDLARLFYLVDNNLRQDIKLGYHAHNNLQLAHSNARFFVETKTTRELIIDTSIMGMGRGAGNLNTELFLDYLINVNDKQYNVQPILSLIDEVVNGFYQKSQWGYSLPNYLSAKHNIHPNYAKFLADKHTLTISEMDAIFDDIKEEKQINFDKNYIEELYVSFMSRGKVKDGRLYEFKQALNGKKVVLIAPGKSAEKFKEKIDKFISQPDVVSISVNFDFGETTDYVFVSNIRRYGNLSGAVQNKVILTSNISAEEFFVKVNYMDLINDDQRVFDNAGLMSIKLLINLGIKEIYLAGFDGYSHSSGQNYVKTSMELSYQNDGIDELNTGMKEVLSKYSEKINIIYLTSSMFEQ